MTQESDIPEKFIRLYRKKVRQFKFSGVSRKEATTEKGQREIMSYLLVNGFIPATKENIALGPKKETYIDAKHLPEDMRKKALDLVNQARKKSTVEEETDLEDHTIDEDSNASPSPESLQGIWISSDGTLFGVKTERSYKATVTDTLDVTFHKPTQLFEQRR
jgi:hypothetical protein